MHMGYGRCKGLCVVVVMYDPQVSFGSAFTSDITVTLIYIERDVEIYQALQ